ncbi:MAG: hypothetical protein MUO50_10210, partial [Longimicrobiales bacterium]|nr:hypothetical protein [Longimicrobiales bacterium]
LTPIVADATAEFPIEEFGLLGLSDGMTSNVHSELRVFDLHFTPVEADSLTDPDAFPRRWCRYHAGPVVRDTQGTGRGIGSLFEGRGWGKMAATSIASGAIPFAFEPVPLERRAYEFGETEDASASRWPKALKGKDRHVFTYFDGGTFNNEPVREAFRLASFIDAQNPEEDFERLILFVDPHVVVPKANFDMPHQGRWHLDGPNLDRKSSLDRLIPLTGAFLTAITNESRVIEADKVFQTRKNFRIRNLIREELTGVLASNPDPTALESLAAKLEEVLETDRTGVMIPAGALTLEGEMRRVIVEEGEPGQFLSDLREKTPEEIRAFVAGPGTAPEDERGVWLRALTFAAVDRVMDLEGKMERSRLVAISPATDPANPGRLEELPGRVANGFGGFMSELAGEHEVKVARYCTQLFLQAAGRIKQRDLPEKPDFSKHRARYLKDVKAGLEVVEDRLVDVISDSHVHILGKLPTGILRYFVRGKLARLAREKRSASTYELRLQVPNMSYEFDGRGLADGDLKPQKIGGKFYLITFASYEEGDPEPWSGPQVVGKKPALKVDRDRKGVIPDKEFCRVALPTKAMLKKGKTLSHPVWVARIRGSDEGERVGSDRWQLVDEVEGLERTVLS